MSEPNHKSTTCILCGREDSLQTTANAMTYRVDLNEVFASILDNLSQMIPNDAANIMLIEGENAVVRACKGYERFGGKNVVLGQVRRIADVPNLIRMQTTGQPVLITNTTLSPNWINFKHSTWIRSYVSAPICRQGRTLGFLNLNSATPNFYTEIHAQHLRAFADQAAIAIENSRLYMLAQAEIAERIKVEAALQKAKDELELRVQERTQELNRAVEELKQELERRQQAEAALERERALLELRIEERTAELSSANAELARAAQMKDSFLANMSHELRTPLNAILNISETLQENIFGELNEKQLRLAHTIEESGRHLLALINDILDLSKMGAGKLELVWDTVSVKEVCEASLKIIQEAAAKKHLTVSTQFDPEVQSVRADQRRLKQILVNLLSNAVKFTPQGKNIGLVVTGDIEKERVLFTVWDQGIGISKENLPMLFKPFTQLDHGLSRQFDGTGLGLALVYHLVELHGGGVQVETEPGAGSKFTVSLNWKGNLKTATPPQGSGPAHNGIEENHRQQATKAADQLKEYLEEMGITVSTFWVENGPDEVPAPGPSTLMILDLPSQALAAQWIQALAGQQDGEKRSPVIILTQGQEPNLVGMELPQFGVISYPFSLQELRSEIKRISPSGAASLLNRAILVRARRLTTARTSATILIVDDNEISVRTMCDYLEARGYRTARAYNGLEAIQRAKEVKPDLILMDIQMPGMDGLEATRRIRAADQIHQTPIVALTALAMPGDRARCLEAGADDYLSKPLSLKNLVAIIDHYTRDAQ